MKWNARFVSSFVVVTALASACPAPPPVISEGEGEGEGEGESGCLTATLGPVTFNFQDDVSTHYQAEIISDFDGAAPDFLVFQFFNYNERIGGLGAGTFPLDDETNDNYGHCAECLLVFADQITDGTAPARVFFQSGGTITVERNPREEVDLIGIVEDLVLVESTIGGEALESEPVPGGDCLELGDVVLDVKFVPDAWTCADEAFNGNDGVCDCDCGVTDSDCFASFDEPPPSTIANCEAEQICTFDGECANTCDADAAAGQGCASGVCALGEPVDFCDGDDVIDASIIGEACSATDFRKQFCNVVDTIPLGLCDFDFDGDGTRLCRARCTTNDECDAGLGEVCQSFLFDEDGSFRGFCDQPPG